MKKIFIVFVYVILYIIAVVLSHASAWSNKGYINNSSNDEKQYIICNLQACLYELGMPKNSGVTNTINGTVYLIVALIIMTFIITAVAMILTAVVIIRNRKTPISRAQIPMRTFRCPQCKTKFKIKSKEVESKKRPIPVKCPNCGIKGVII